jgi:predicted nucleic acid-binding Zn ribbon protein
MKSIPRVPKDYDGNLPTGRQADDLLPQVMKEIAKQFEESSVLIEKVWKEIVGPKISDLTRVTGFQKGVVFIQVKNATLMSILSSQEKPRLLQNLRHKLPNIHFVNLVFQFG